jgi:hypothetical protein
LLIVSLGLEELKHKVHLSGSAPHCGHQLFEACKEVNAPIRDNKSAEPTLKLVESGVMYPWRQIAIDIEFWQNALYNQQSPDL